jgi:predicted Zn-dependent protease with MMP-like domain
MSAEGESAEHVLDQAWDALSEGRPEEALELLEGVSPEVGERWTTSVHALLELGDLTAAEKALASAREASSTDPEELCWAEGRLRLSQWKLAEARAAFERLDPDRAGAPLFENLALLADLAGDHRRADGFHRRAREADPEEAPLPPRLTSQRFEELVARAARELPEEFQRALEEIAVVIDPMPTAELVGAPGSGHPPDILGLFVGRPLGERASADPAEMPPTIFLFQRNLERASRTQSELCAEIRTTLYHELGHALGFDEEGVDRMGLG